MLKNPTLTVTKDAASKAGNTVVKAVCPSLGDSYVHLSPASTTHAKTTNVTTATTYAAYAAKDNAMDKMLYTKQ
jgi:hypothetical protein